MPKLLQINATCNWGSTGHIAEQIAVFAKNSGWDCYLAHGARYINKSSIKTFKIGSKLDNLLHAIISRYLGKHGLGSYFATKRFVRYIEKIEPDIIHLHNIHGYYLNYRVLFKYLKKSETPIVWTLHDCWSMTGQCTHFVSANCQKWKSKIGCSHCPLLNASYKTLVDRSDKNWRCKRDAFTSLENLTIVPVSYWLESIVRESYLGGKQIQTIHNGVDTTVFHPLRADEYSLKKYNLDNQKYIVGVATDWSDKKGFSDYCTLSSMMPSGVKIVLVGLTEHLCKEAERSGIIGIKRTDNVKELVELYNGASIVMNLSYEETFGLTTVEGYACGVPSIVYRATASPELVTPQTGLIVEPGDIGGVAKAITTILNRGKKCYSEACRTHAIKEYEKNSRAQEYVDLYNRLLNMRCHTA